MKNILLLAILTITFGIDTNGQNLIFIGENSFLSTETFTLKSNSDDEDITDLNLTFSKDGTQALVVVSSKLVSTVRISEKLIIYLNDGTVIICVDKGINDNVDDVATSAYHLTKEDLEKMKNSNINTIRYEIKCAECVYNILYEGVYSASNKGSSEIDFTAVISNFFK